MASPPKPSSCVHCALHRDGPPYRHCVAFPGGIPRAVLEGDEPHATPLESQEGTYVWTPRPGVQVLVLIARGELDESLIDRAGATDPRWTP